MRVLIFILSIQILAANIASSGAMDWSFSEKPYPRREELSDVPVPLALYVDIYTVRGLYH